MKLVVLQIDVMYNFRHLTQALDIVQAETFEQCLKRTVFSMMSELRAIHVERNRAHYRLAFSDKVKARAFVDELPDQPGGSQAIDMQVASSHPAATLVTSQTKRS